MTSPGELTAEERRQKHETLAALRAIAENLIVEVGQEWEYAGLISLINPDKRLYLARGHRAWPQAGHKIRITQVAGRNRARTTRYVKVDPPRGGNGGYDRQTHSIRPLDLARSWRLVQDAPADDTARGNLE